jgi:membrane protein DedA with SNARE-associated domain
MNLSSLVEQYGYFAVFVGALAEGESLLLAAGYAAHRGWLNLPEVVLAAFAGGMLGDLFFFWLGRTRGERLMARHPQVARHAQRMRGLLQRHPNSAILSVRFLYGLRTAGPIALGALGVPVRRFVLLNLLGALLWASLFTALGFQFGDTLQWWLDDLRGIEEAVLGGLLLAGVLWTLWRWRRGQRTKAGSTSA